MPAKKIPSIRPISRNQAHTRIRNLKCYPEMYDRMINGWPMAELARFIREVKKESTDISEGGLIMALQEFRDSLPKADLLQKRMPKAFIAAAEAVEKGLDEVKEMEDLYRLQMERVRIDFAHEKGIKKLMPTMGQEVRIAREILSNVADLKMSLGLSKRHLGQLDVDARVLTDVAVRYESNAPNVKQVMANPQSRLKILGLVEKLLTRSTAQVVGDPTDIPAAPGIIDVEGISSMGEAETPTTVDELFPEFEDDKKEESQ